MIHSPLTPQNVQFLGCTKDCIGTANPLVINSAISSEILSYFLLFRVAKNTTIFTRVRVGASYSRTGGKLYKIKKVISHEKYSGSTDYDIAIIRVVEPFKFSERVKTIPLAKTEPKEGEMALVTGYGRTKPMKRSVSISQRPGAFQERSRNSARIQVLLVAACYCCRVFILG